jgi:FixJ family two-component response regulator
MEALDNIIQKSQITVMVIDDEDIVRFSLRKKLAKFGYNVISLDKAEDALYMLKNEEVKVDFIVTDIKLRKMDGIEFLRHIKTIDISIPVIITGQGNVDDAIQALRYGARDFIKKPIDENEIASIIRSEVKRKIQEQLAVDIGKFVKEERREFILPLDVEAGDVLAHELTKNLHSTGLFTASDAENIGVALRESISNAIFHGNLEMSSDIRESGGNKAFKEEFDKRRNDPLYSGRTVRVFYHLHPDFVEFEVEDEGKGFNSSALPDPTDPENFFKKSGRGILYVRLYMDDVEWNDKGNRIRMRKNTSR